MNIGYCKDCKWWEHKWDGRNHWDECHRPNWVSYSRTIDDDDLAYYANAADDTNLDAGIKTGPLFGCVKFTPKP